VNLQKKEIGMFFSRRTQNPKLLMVLGMSCLVVAIVTWKQPIVTGLLGPNWSDGLIGFLFGLSIALNLWSVRLTALQRRGQSGCTTA
jgi:hypothetical protein